jgi:hypothetical protein
LAPRSAARTHATLRCPELRTSESRGLCSRAPTTPSLCLTRLRAALAAQMSRGVAPGAYSLPG